MITKIGGFIKKRKYILISLCILIILAALVFKSNNGMVESYTVERADIKETVALSGKVETSAKADLGFAVSGRLSKIYVANNELVSERQILAQLEVDDLIADLRIKEANSKTFDIDLKYAKDKLEQITSQENEKVTNVYRSLMTLDLELTPTSNTYIATTPAITGMYNGEEGTYKVIISREDPSVDDFTLRTFGLEKTSRLIDKEKPTPLGTKGLYISFPDNLEDYADTIWYLEIPNKSSTSYLANYNAYVEAKNDKDLKIKDAMSEYDLLLSKEGDGLSVAEAEIQKIKAEIKKNTIYAPFTGLVTNIEKEVGENAGVGERIISILGEGNLEVVLQVSELDVSKLPASGSVQLAFDAFKGEEFSGILKTINSRETVLDGVPVYEAFVELRFDPRIKTGMSASGVIILNEATDVLALPSYLVKKEGDKNFVLVLSPDGGTEKREITLGLTGSDSMAEVLTGLTEGEQIVSSE